MDLRGIPGQGKSEILLAEAAAQGMEIFTIDLPTPPGFEEFMEMFLDDFRTEGGTD